MREQWENAGTRTVFCCLVAAEKQILLYLIKLALQLCL